MMGRMRVWGEGRSRAGIRTVEDYLSLFFYFNKCGILFVRVNMC